MKNLLALLILFLGLAQVPANAACSSTQANIQSNINAASYPGANMPQTSLNTLLQTLNNCMVNNYTLGANVSNMLAQTAGGTNTYSSVLYSQIGSSGHTIPWLDGNNTASGSLALTSSNSNVINLYSSPPSNYIGFHSGGPFLSFYTASGYAGPNTMHAQNYSIMQTTATPGSFQEYGKWIEVDANSGHAPLWTTNLALNNTTNSYVTNNNNVYQNSVASCTTAGAGGGPTWTSGTNTDGTCSLTYIGASQGSVGLGIVTILGANAGSVWGHAFNQIITAGHDPKMFSAGGEWDFNFQDGDHGIGTGNGPAYGLLMEGFNAPGALGTAAISVNNGANANWMWHYGFLCSGATSTKDGCFVSGTSGNAAFANNGTPAIASFWDFGGGVRGFYANATYTGSVIDLTTATAPVGINLAGGTFSTKQINGNGFNVDSSGNITANSYKSGATAGVSCGAGTVNLTTFVVTNGIVTHC